MDCFWETGCSDKRRCNSFGSCVAKWQSQNKDKIFHKDIDAIHKQQTVSCLESEIDDHQRRILELEEGLRAIYAEAGDDTEIGEICRDLLK